MRRFRHPLGAVLVWSLLSATAAAQTSITIQGVAREKQQSPSPTSRINLADCLADDKVSLTLGLDQTFKTMVWKFGRAMAAK